ncbi:hypothetical protein RRG08_001758 [Elysia crispata]|uniref:Uncharacterized protein n=1 Tax=Elysia crispata TaxID=231223 RepID=A0AAE1ALJ0_9GAST|nr:hypothetical protein RRG08_001758 [Elysia crispata]
MNEINQREGVAAPFCEGQSRVYNTLCGDELQGSWKPTRKPKPCSGSVHEPPQALTTGHQDKRKEQQ